MSGLEVVYINRSEIKLWKNNPRVNNSAAVSLAKIILQNGVRSPVILWRENMTAYKGNTTLKALDIINANTEYKVPCVLHDFKSEEDAIAYGIADNKASEFAEWDTGLLAALFNSTTVPIRKPATGFKEQEIFDLLAIKKEEKMRRKKKSSITLQCRDEDITEIKELLQDWINQSGFEDMEVF
jgi:hypothetical protein